MNVVEFQRGFSLVNVGGSPGLTPDCFQPCGEDVKRIFQLILEALAR